MAAVSRGLDRSRSLAGILAFGAVYIVWGSTYLGIKFAIETIPPLLMTGARFVLAARGESHTATRADLFRHLCVAEPPEYSRYSGVSAP